MFAITMYVLKAIAKGHSDLHACSGLQVARALARGNPKEVLVYHKSSNIEMMRGHMACLNDLNRLNDEVINVYMGLLLVRTQLMRI